MPIRENGAIPTQELQFNQPSWSGFKIPIHHVLKVNPVVLPVVANSARYGAISLSVVPVVLSVL